MGGSASTNNQARRPFYKTTHQKHQEKSWCFFHAFGLCVCKAKLKATLLLLGVGLVALRGLLLNSTPVLRILPCVEPKLSPCVATQLGNKVVGYAVLTDVWQSGGAWSGRLWYVLCGSWGKGCVLFGKECASFGLSCVLLGRGGVFERWGWCWTFPMKKIVQMVGKFCKAS